MPTPVSATTSSAWEGRRRRVTVTCPASVNLRALERRLDTIRSHMTRSTHTGSGRGGQSITSRSPAASAALRKTPTRSRVRADRSVGSNAPRRRPVSTWEKSSRDCTIRSRRRAPRWASSRSKAMPGARFGRSARAASRGPRRRVSGVRNSWLTLAKNSVLARSRSARASCRPRSRWRARAPVRPAAIRAPTWSRNVRYPWSTGRRALRPRTSTPAGRSSGARRRGRTRAPGGDSG